MAEPVIGNMGWCGQEDVLGITAGLFDHSGERHHSIGSKVLRRTARCRPCNTTIRDQYLVDHSVCRLGTVVYASVDHPDVSIIHGSDHAVHHAPLPILFESAQYERGWLELGGTPSVSDSVRHRSRKCQQRVGDLLFL